MKWFNELASDDPRREPFFQNAIRDLACHPQAAEELAAMSEPERAAARNVLEKMASLPAERRTSCCKRWLRIEIGARPSRSGVNPQHPFPIMAYT
jgi:hypothetical protein